MTRFKLVLIEEKEPGRVYLTRYSGKQPTGEVAAYERDNPVEREDIEHFRKNGYDSDQRVDNQEA